jgi:hypothetical protein
MEKKKVESFPLPILEKRLLYSRSNKTIDVNPVSIQPVVETQQMVAEKKDDSCPCSSFKNRGPIR